MRTKITCYKTKPKYSLICIIYLQPFIHRIIRKTFIKWQELKKALLKRPWRWHLSIEFDSAFFVGLIHFPISFTWRRSVLLKAVKKNKEITDKGTKNRKRKTKWNLIKREDMKWKCMREPKKISNEWYTERKKNYKEWSTQVTKNNTLWQI